MSGWCARQRGRGERENEGEKGACAAAASRGGRPGKRAPRTSACRSSCCRRMPVAALRRSLWADSASAAPSGTLRACRARAREWLCPGARAGAQRACTARHAYRRHLQPLVVGAGRLVDGLLLPAHGTLASRSHLQRGEAHVAEVSAARGAAWARTVRCRTANGRAPARRLRMGPGAPPPARAAALCARGALGGSLCTGQGAAQRGCRARAAGRAWRQRPHRGLQLRQLLLVHRHCVRTALACLLCRALGRACVCGSVVLELAQAARSWP